MMVKELVKQNRGQFMNKSSCIQGWGFLISDSRFLIRALEPPTAFPIPAIIGTSDRLTADRPPPTANRPPPI